MKRLATASLLTLLACDAPELVDDVDPLDPEQGARDTGGIIPDSETARVVLMMANTYSFEKLDDEVKLNRRVVENIFAFRFGADGRENTGDDQRFITLAQLDAIPFMGEAAFDAMVDYATAQGLLLGTCESDAECAGKCMFGRCVDNVDTFFPAKAMGSYRQAVLVEAPTANVSSPRVFTAIREDLPNLGTFYYGRLWHTTGTEVADRGERYSNQPQRMRDHLGNFVDFVALPRFGNTVSLPEGQACNTTHGWGIRSYAAAVGALGEHVIATLRASGNEGELFLCRKYGAIWLEDLITPMGINGATRVTVRFDQNDEPQVLLLNKGELQRWRLEEMDAWKMVPMAKKVTQYAASHHGIVTHVFVHGEVFHLGAPAGAKHYYIAGSDDPIESYQDLGLPDTATLIEATGDAKGNAYALYRLPIASGRTPFVLVRVDPQGNVLKADVAQLESPMSEGVSFSVGDDGTIYLAATSLGSYETRTRFRTIFPL